MKVKVSQIVNSKFILDELNNTRIPINVAYKVNKLVQETNIVLGEFDKARTELLDKYARKDKKTGEYKFTVNKNKDLFTKAIKTIMEPEVEFPDITITIDELTGPFNVTAATIDLVDWFIK